MLLGEHSLARANAAQFGLYPSTALGTDTVALGFAAALIRHLVGSYSGVMGLPLLETAELLAAPGRSL
jgi:predicted house-cleaning NTP pyrophosphatase (Maf/HAM1 superfamily)